MVAVGLCFLVAVLEGFDIQAMGVAAPRLAPQFGLNASQMGWVFSISNIGLVIGAGLGGCLADKSGRKPVLIGAVADVRLLHACDCIRGQLSDSAGRAILRRPRFGAALPNLMAIAAEISRPGRRHRPQRSCSAACPSVAGSRPSRPSCFRRIRLAHAVHSRRRVAHFARPGASRLDARNAGTRFHESRAARPAGGGPRPVRRGARHAHAAAVARVPSDASHPLSIPELAADPDDRQGVRPRGRAAALRSRSTSAVSRVRC